MYVKMALAERTFKQTDVHTSAAYDVKPESGVIAVAVCGELEAARSGDNSDDSKSRMRLRVLWLKLKGTARYTLVTKTNRSIRSVVVRRPNSIATVSLSLRIRHAARGS